MALGDDRQASGRRMEQARRQSGAAMESQRRALDAQMVARRRGESVVQDMQRLESPPRVQRSLPSVTPRGGIPAARGRAYYTDKPKMGGSGGIASPLSEQTRVESGVDVPDRDYWPATQIATTDGLLFFSYTPTKVWRLEDADGNPVLINVARPRSAV